MGGDSGGGGVCYRDIAYCPLPSQSSFHRSTARFKGFSGPVGSGKSQALCQEAIRLSYLNPGRMGLLGAPTYPMLRDVAVTTLLEILSRNGIPHELHKAENMLVLRDTRSRIVFRAVEEFERLRGTNLAWFGLDELTYTTEDAWLRLEGRLRDPRATRLCGFAVWTPKGFDWVYRRFIGEPVDGYEVILAPPFENRHLTSKVPDYYDRLRKSYDPRFYDQEVLGKYLNVHEGTVYHTFERRQNVKEAAADPRLPLLWSLDFNVDPMCSVVAQTQGEQVVVLDELVLSRSSTLEACEEFQQRFPQHHAGIVVYGDASGTKRQTTGTSDYETVRRFFHSAGYGRVSYQLPRANPAVRERVNLVNSLLRSADGETRLTVDPRCKELILDFEQVCYKPGAQAIDKDKDLRRTHLSDALGYLVYQEFQGRGAAGEKKDRLL